MRTDKRPLPGKVFAVFFMLIYILTQLVFLIIVIGNMPLFRDIVDMSTPERVGIADFFNEFYLPAAIVASSIQFVLLVLLVFTFTDRRWPLLITFITVFVNLLICGAAVSAFYIIDLRDVYFTFQIVFLIPIISIFLGSVFVIDDTVDLLRGKFESHISGITRNAQNRFERARSKHSGQTESENTDEDFMKKYTEEITAESPAKEDGALPSPESRDYSGYTPYVNEEISRAAELVLPFDKT